MTVVSNRLHYVLSFPVHTHFGSRRSRKRLSSPEKRLTAPAKYAILPSALMLVWLSWQSSSLVMKILDLLRSPPKLRDAGGLTMNRKIKRIPQTTLSMKRAFDEFVVAQTAKGLTEPTIKNYHAHFHSISSHIDIEKSFSDLTQTDIDGMIVSMRKSGLATNWTVLHRSTCTACPSVSRCGCRSSAQGGLWCIAHSSSYAPRLM